MSKNENEEQRQKTFDGYKKKQVGRLYGVLCEREKNGEWKKFLHSIIIEIKGNCEYTINFWSLIGKLSMLKYMDYDEFRSSQFECLNQVKDLQLREDAY